MRIFHLSDLHIGRQLHYYSLIDNQRYVLNKIVESAEEQRPDAILISGDIYDKSMPSGEAYNLFDEFLNKLSDISPNIPVMIIAGNHDSSDRLNFASTFMEKHSIYISVYPPREKDEYLKKVVLTDEYGKINFYMLPFIKPGYVRHIFKEGAITSYDSAVRAIIERENIDYSERNVILSHQFYVSAGKAPKTCDSEQTFVSVGGIDSVDSSIIEKFDYAALGHIHGKQSVGSEHIRYCGTPLKYSVSEEKHKKSISVVNIGKKGEELSIEEIFLDALNDVRSERGTLREVIDRANDENRKDFVSITLTDEEDPYKPKEQLEEYYDQILELKIENSRTRKKLQDTETEGVVLDPFEAFGEFYQKMQNMSMSEPEEEIMLNVINTARGDEEV